MQRLRIVSFDLDYVLNAIERFIYFFLAKWEPWLQFLLLETFIPEKTIW